MNWSKPEKVLQVILAGDKNARDQSANRVRINNAANNKPPLDDATAEKQGLRINVSWGEMPELVARAKLPFENATFGQQRYFKYSLARSSNPPQDRKLEWEMAMTDIVNELLKEDEDLSDQYIELKSDEIGSVVPHGLAPIVWFDEEEPLPEFIALEDFRVPTDSRCSFRKQEWFAVRHHYTPGEFAEKVWGKEAVEGWNKKAAVKIFKEYKGVNFSDWDYNWDNAPEKMAERLVQQRDCSASDAVPTIPLWAFYYRDQDNHHDWWMCMVPDTEALRPASITDFVFQSAKPVASKLSHLMQCQYGDLNVKKPALYYSVRGLGFLLLDPLWWQNLTRCRFVQHVHEHMNVWWQNIDPQDRLKAQFIQTYDKCVLPPGVRVVTQAERPQIDLNLVNSAQAQMKQLSNEASVSYTQELDTGTRKEETATLTIAKMQQVNAMSSGLLVRWFMGEKKFGREVFRRLCLPGSVNEHAMRFRTRCKQARIPDKWINHTLWIVEAEMPMGAGNPTMALMQAKELLAPEIYNRVSGQAQGEIMHDALAAITGDSKRAARWSPIGGSQGLPTAEEFAQNLFPALMTGVASVKWKPGLSLVDGVGTLIRLLAERCGQIQKSGGMTDMKEIQGLANVSAFAKARVQELAQDENEKQQVKVFMDDLGALDNELKGFAQRLAEQQQAQPTNGEGQAEMMKTQAALQGKQAIDAAKAKATELKAAQTRRHKELGFMGEQKRKDQMTAAEIRRQGLRTMSEVAGNRMKSLQE